MKKINILTVMALSMILFSCAKVIEESIVDKQKQEIEETEVLIPLSFTATSAETKTELADNGISINWLNTDEISVFDGTNNRPFSVEGLADGEKSTTVTFSGSASDVDTYYALYPYNSTATLDGTTINTTLADEQNAVEGSFGNGFNINAAKSTDKTTFSFTNVLSVVKFTVDNTKLDGKTIKKVELFFTKPAAGDVSISVSSSISASAGTTTVNHVSMEDAGGLADGNYYFTILPQSAGKIRFQITSTDGFVARKEAVISSAFVAGNIKPIGTIKNLTWTKAYFYESFDSYENEGGNDGQWDKANNTAISPAPSGWSTFTKVYPANRCVKLASSSASGIATTAALSNIPSSATDVKIAFKAARWSGKSENFTVTPSTEDGPYSSFSLVDNAWTQVKDLNMTGATNASTITFTAGSSGNQTYLDEVLVYVGDVDLAYELARGDASDDLPSPLFGASINSEDDIPAAGAARTITITGNVAWTASATKDGSPANTILSTTSGSGGGFITVTIPENDSTSDTPEYVVSVTTTEEVATKTYSWTLNQDAKTSSYTIVFGNNVNSATGLTESTRASTVISDGTTYVTTSPFTVGSGNIYYGDTKTCIRLGKSGNASSLTIALSDAGKVSATSIVVSCKNMGGTKNSSATLNVNAIGAQTTATTEDNYTFTFGSATTIESITLAGSAAIYIYSITVNY